MARTGNAGNAKGRVRVGRGVEAHLAEELERRVMLASAVAAFGVHQTFGVGLVPQTVAVADLNRDGRLDLVTANQGDDTLSVLLGNGDGSFGAQVKFGGGSYTSAVAVGDLNGDGKPDLAVANLKSGTAGVLLGNGDGAFVTMKTFGAGQYPRSVAAVDVNGDGKIDLVLANYFGNNVSVLLGNGDGTFQTQKLFSTQSEPTWVTAADLNGDGKMDLAVSNRASNTVSVLLGNGDGTFVFQKTFGTGSNPISVAAGDLNGDGKLDLVASNYVGNTVSVLLGNGDGTFAGQNAYGTGIAPGAVTVADVNVDGKLDLVAANSTSGDVSVLLGNGDATFKPQSSFATDAGPASVAVADFNRDGRPDLVTANSVSGTVSVLLGDVPPVVTGINRQTAGPITSRSTLGWVVTFSEPVTGVDQTDFQLIINGTNGGLPDSVAQLNPSLYIVSKSGLTSSGGTVGLKLVDDGSIKNAGGNPLQGAGVGFGAAPVLATGTGPYSIETAEVNGNGTPDLIVVNRNSGNAGVLLGNGNGTFQAQQTFATGSLPFSVAVADVNGDGKADLVVANSTNSANSGTVSVLLGNGNGTFQQQQTFAAGRNPVSVIAVDVNGDGKVDLVSANFYNGAGGNCVSVLLGNGNGAFQAPQTFAAGTNPVSIATSDVNGDGKVDLVVANNTNPGWVSVLLGNGNGTFRTPLTFASGASPVSIATSDVNGDGKVDLIVANNTNPGRVSVLLGNGDGTFQAPLTFATGANSVSTTTSDINGDGKTDLVVANYFNGVDGNSVSILLGNGNGTFQAQQTFGTGMNPDSVTTSDVNGDGRADVVVANHGSNTASVLLGNSGGDFVGQTYILATSSDTITGTSGVDQITLTQDPDHTHIDWTMGSTVGQIAINDANGLTIVGNGGHDVINLDYSAGNPLPNLLKINQPQGSPSVNDVTINGIDSTHLLSGTTIDINTSKVFITYASAGVDPISSIVSYLVSGRGNNTWTGTAPVGGGAIRSSAAALNPNLFSVGYADNATDPTVNATSNSIELMYTIAADANLDGQVTLGDFSALSTGFGNGTRWTQADFTYDRQVTLADFSVLSTTFGQSLAAGGPAVTSAAVTSTDVGPVTAAPVVRSGGVVGSTAEAVNAGAGVVDRGGGVGEVLGKKRNRRGNFTG